MHVCRGLFHLEAVLLTKLGHACILYSHVVVTVSACVVIMHVECVCSLFFVFQVSVMLTTHLND